ncbi:MAG: MATE family efflux transporter, partial [Anaerovoracaceae bacterium]
MLTIKDFIGTREFYKRVIILAVPIMIQNGITNFVNLLDNIMVGQVGMEQVSGIGIDNQLIYIFNLCIFGAISGPGLFGAQFFGKKDYEGVKSTFRFKIIICGIIGVLGITIAVFFSDGLIGLYLHESDTTGDVALTLLSAKNYMMIMAIGFIPFSIMQVYTSTLREGGETMLPMKASAIAVLVNV